MDSLLQPAEETATAELWWQRQVHLLLLLPHLWATTSLGPGESEEYPETDTDMGCFDGNNVYNSASLLRTVETRR